MAPNNPTDSPERQGEPVEASSQPRKKRIANALRGHTERERDVLLAFRDATTANDGVADAPTTCDYTSVDPQTVERAMDTFEEEHIIERVDTEETQLNTAYPVYQFRDGDIEDAVNELDGDASSA